MSSSRICNGLRCKGVMAKTRTLDGLVKWVCPRCGREEDKTGARVTAGDKK